MPPLCAPPVESGWSKGVGCAWFAISWNLWRKAISWHDNMMDWTFTNVCIINVVIYIIVVTFADVKQILVKLWYTEMGGFGATGYWMLLVSLGKWPWWSLMQLINWWMSNKHESRSQKVFHWLQPDTLGTWTTLNAEIWWNSGEIQVVITQNFTPGLTRGLGFHLAFNADHEELSGG